MFSFHGCSFLGVPVRLFASIVPPEKKTKFAILREGILSSPLVSLKTLQRFAGKVVSFSIAIPGCTLYVREVFGVIAQLTRSSRVSAKVRGNLRSDIEYWRFLDDWSDCLPWKTEQHCIVTLFSDASKRSWGGVLFKDGNRIESRDYWLDASDDINSLEARALLNSLLAFRDHIRDSRVDVHSDNLTLKAALNNFGCKSSSVNESVKEILQCSRRYNFAINVHYVPSRDNLADGPSRPCSDLDCTLSEKLGIWWSGVLVLTPLTLCLWTVTVGEIVSASLCPIILRGQLQLRKGLMSSLSPSRWDIIFTFFRHLYWWGLSSGIFWTKSSMGPLL